MLCVATPVLPVWRPFKMAKALLGHVASNVDRRLLDEVTRLRTRVRDLEAEVARLRAESEADEVDLDHGLRRLSTELTEPALT